MEIVTVVLLVALCIVGWLYWLSVRNLNGLTNYLILLLLNEDNYRKQCGNLRSLVADTPLGGGPLEFWAKITFMVGKLIAGQDKARIGASVVQLLWQLKAVTPSASANGHTIE